MKNLKVNLGERISIRAIVKGVQLVHPRSGNLDSFIHEYSIEFLVGKQKITAIVDEEELVKAIVAYPDRLVESQLKIYDDALREGEAGNIGN